MLLSAVSVFVVAQTSSEIPEGLMNNPVFLRRTYYLQVYVDFVYVIFIGRTGEGKVCPIICHEDPEGE